jgi:hypothetical protein
MAPPAATGPILPISTGERVSPYIVCLFEPVDTIFAEGLPPTRELREALVSRILAECRETRTRSATAVELELSGQSGFDDEAVRRTTVDYFLTSIEGTLRSMIVRHEEWIEADRREACLGAGDTEAC